MNECKYCRTKTVNDGYAPGGGDKKVFLYFLFYFLSSKIKKITTICSGILKPDPDTRLLFELYQDLDSIKLEWN